MSPILDLQNLTPISLEELGESKPEEKKELDKPIEKSFNSEKLQQIEVSVKEEIKPKKKELFIKKPKLNNTDMEPKTPSQELLLSIKECETISGISKVSIRKAIKEKEINYLLQNGKYQISFKELLKWCYSSTRRKNVLNNSGIGKYVEEWR